ncbi:MAG: hypothetical protein KAQ78_01440 [Candidatus Latescibacteria bacterium]|nr:hypothetical protein [Candidatus Latescibacterota bacterium]
MRNIGFLMVVLLVGLFACANTGEEALGYAHQIARLQHYNETLEQYLKSLDADPEGKGAVTRIAQLLENYKTDLAKIPSPVDSKLRAMHGRYKRNIATSQRRLLPPDDLAFAIQARRAIMGLKEDIKDSIYPVVRELLDEHNLGDRVSLKWPSEE